MPTINSIMRERLQGGLSGTADVQQVSEAVTLTIPGVVTDIPATLVTDLAMDRSPDQTLQVEAIVRVRRDLLPTPLPTINKTHQAQVTLQGSTTTYTILRVTPDTSLDAIYRLDLRRTQGAIYG